MAAYLDHILCLLPFEPAALHRLHGPEGTYVGHPLIERLEDLRPQSAPEQAAREDAGTPNLLLLPGSRMSEIRRLLPVFLETIIRPELAHAQVTLPTLARLVAPINALLGEARSRVHVVSGEGEKLKAFRTARAALAASGTVTLELALAGIPTVAAYRVANWEAFILRRMIKLTSVLLPNIILNEKAVPEFLQHDANPVTLAGALAPLLAETPARAAQLEAFSRVEDVMMPGHVAPSQLSAQAVLDLVAKPRHLISP